jgi:hypothetical protein
MCQQWYIWCGAEDGRTLNLLDIIPLTMCSPKQRIENSVTITCTKHFKLRRWIEEYNIQHNLQLISKYANPRISALSSL